MNCPNCGTFNNDDFKFCIKCGNSLETTTPNVVEPVTTAEVLTEQSVEVAPTQPVEAAPAPVQPTMNTYQQPKQTQQPKKNNKVLIIVIVLVIIGIIAGIVLLINQDKKEPANNETNNNSEVENNNETAEKDNNTSGKVEEGTNTTYDENGDFLLAIEDVFTITGKGTVATGKVERGKVKVGDTVQIIGLKEEILTTEVIAIEMFRKEKNRFVYIEKNIF